MPFTLKLDMIQTLALAAVVLFLGYGVRKRIGVLDRFNIPAPVIGGFLFAALSLILRQAGVLGFEFDTTLQAPLMIAFFTTIGLGASLKPLRSVDRRWSSSGSWPVWSRRASIYSAPGWLRPWTSIRSWA